MRGGAKAGGRTAVVYLARTGNAQSMAGFAVSRAVGGAVARNLIKRRLRAVVGGVLPSLPRGSWVVVRALPGASSVTYSDLCADVVTSLARAGARLSR